MTILIWLMILVLEALLLWGLTNAIARVAFAQDRLTTCRPLWRAKLKTLTRQAHTLRTQVGSLEAQTVQRLLSLPVELSLLCLKPSPLQWLVAQGIRQGLRRKK